MFKLKPTYSSPNTKEFLNVGENKWNKDVTWAAWVNILASIELKNERCKPFEAWRAGKYRWIEPISSLTELTETRKGIEQIASLSDEICYV